MDATPDAIVRIAFADPAYPPLLRQIADPPEELFVRGNAALLARADHVAAVGTRKMTRYGDETARRLAGAVAAAGAPVVSGLAFGIDSSAHEGALDAGGVTIAVLPGGVTVRCPRRNS